MARVAPFRPTNTITQVFNDGIVKICSVTNTAPAGHQPQLTLTQRERLCYEERRLGINRLYLSREYQAEIERVIRIQRRPISTQDIAITEDGHRYEVDSIQTVDGVYPPCLDLALRTTKQIYNGEDIT